MTRAPSTASTPRQPRRSPITPERGRAQQIAGHRAGQRAADRDLALCWTDEIAGQAHRHRKHAAGADAGKNARREQQRERRRQRAEDVGDPEQHQAHDHQPRLAEQVGGRAQHRLHDREGEGEHRGETRRGRDADAEIVGDMRQHRIERARRQARGEGRQRDDVEGRRQALLMRPQPAVRHQRARSFRDSCPVLGERVERHQRPQQTLELAQRHHVGPVRRRMVGIRMGLDEHAGDADRDRGARQHRHEFALTAR